MKAIVLINWLHRFNKKNQGLYILLLLLVTISTCSENTAAETGPVKELTEDSAARLIKECHTIQARTGAIGWVKLGRTRFEPSKKEQAEILERYRKLEADGFVELSDSTEDRYGKVFTITATDKARPFVRNGEADEDGVWRTKNVYMYGYHLNFIEVKQVHEVPMFNGAEVTTTMRGVATPFYEFMKDQVKAKNPLEPRDVKVLMKNTSDGWIYCDDKGNRLKM